MSYWRLSLPDRSSHGARTALGRSSSLPLSLDLTSPQLMCILGSSFPVVASFRGSPGQRMGQSWLKACLRPGGVSPLPRSPVLGCWGVIHRISSLRASRSGSTHSSLSWYVQEPTPAIRAIGSEQPCRLSSSPTESLMLIYQGRCNFEHGQKSTCCARDEALCEARVPLCPESWIMRHNMAADADVLAAGFRRAMVRRSLLLQGLPHRSQTLYRRD